MKTNDVKQLMTNVKEIGYLEAKTNYDEVLSRITKLEENEKRRRSNFMFAVCLVLYLLGGVVIGVILDRVALGMI